MNIELIINDFLGHMCKEKEITVVGKRLFVREFVKSKKLKVEDKLNREGTYNTIQGRYNRTFSKYFIETIPPADSERFNRGDIKGCAVVHVKDYSKKHGESYDIVLELTDNKFFRETIYNLSKKELMNCINFIENKEKPCKIN